MRTYGYARVSTTRQGEEGHSLEAQSKRILAYAAMKGLEIPVIFVDSAASAVKQTLHERVQGAQLLHYLQPGDHVIVTKLDRAFRNTRDALENIEKWKAQGITFHSTDLGVDLSTPMGRFFFTVLAAFAELEGATISERTKAGLDQARSEGILPARAPHGFTRDPEGRFTPEREGLIVVASLLRMREALWPVERRLAEINRRGWVTPSGLPYDKKRLKDMMETVMKHRAQIVSGLETLGLRVTCDEAGLVVRDRSDLTP